MGSIGSNGSHGSSGSRDSISSHHSSSSDSSDSNGSGGSTSSGAEVRASRKSASQSTAASLKKNPTLSLSPVSRRVSENRSGVCFVFFRFFFRFFFTCMCERRPSLVFFVCALFGIVRHCFEIFSSSSSNDLDSHFTFGFSLTSRSILCQFFRSYFFFPEEISLSL